MSDRRVMRAFALVELLVLLVVGGALAAFLVIGTGEGRRRARVAGSISNLQQFAAGAGPFAADNADRWFSFSWRKGEIHHAADGYTFPPALTDNQAFADQAVAIMRNRGQRIDIGQIQGWAAPISFNHLALIDYLGRALPAEFTASPSDRNVLAWQRAVRPPVELGARYFVLQNRPNAGLNSNSEKRWPYVSSYRMGPAFYSPDARVGTVDTYGPAPGSHRFYVVGNDQTVLGMRRVSEVRYPANKTMMFESYPDDQGQRWVFYAYDRVRKPLLFADGSVSVRSMSDANAGFDPNAPSSPGAVRLNYQPEGSWEPPTLNGAPSEFVFGRVQWTRSGLRGRDFGGAEVAWVP